jgi:hypothetical protein
MDNGHAQTPVTAIMHESKVTHQQPVRASTAMSRDELDHRLTFHPFVPAQRERAAEITTLAREYGRKLLELSPGGREQALAITALEESVMWATAAIARRE